MWILSPLIRVKRNTYLKFSCSRYDEFFSVSELNLKDWLLRDNDTVYRQVFTSSCINIGGNINNEMTHSQIKPPLQLQLCLTNPGRKEYSNSFSSFNDIHYSTVFDSLFSIYSGFRFKNRIDITHTVQSEIYIRFVLTYSLFLRSAMNKEKQMVHSVVKCSFT